MLDLDKTVPFDPGFNPILANFVPVYEEAIAHVNSIKNFNQKKITYSMQSPKIEQALRSTLGFWVGCILWGVYLKYKFEQMPKEITGNTLLNITQDELSEFEFGREFDLIENYLKNYSRDTKYFLGKSSEIPKKYLEIFKDYKEFSKINNFFVNTRFTYDIKIPKKYDLQYNPKELEKIYNLIMSVISTGNLSNFLGEKK